MPDNEHDAAIAEHKRTAQEIRDRAATARAATMKERARVEQLIKDAGRKPAP